MTVEVYPSGLLEPAALTGFVVRGKAGRALERMADGAVSDPDDRRTPGAAKYHRESLSPATRRAYTRWIKQYVYFCGVAGRRDLPATAATLEHFMEWLAKLQPQKGRNSHKGAGMAPATMRQALSAVHAFHDAANAAWPSTRLALKVIRGHENIRATMQDVHDDQGAPPIKQVTLLQLIRACPTDTNAGIRDRAILALGFSIMARRSELANLDEQHITEDEDEDDGTLRVHVPTTKTQRIEGRVAFVAPWKKKHPDVCPVRCLNAWTQRRHELGITDGPYFRAVDRWDHVLGGPNPYAGKSETMRMDPADIELVVARAAGRALKAGEKIANAAALRPHSLRAGGATSSYEAGADILAIARQGGWGDNSPVVFRYIREIDQKKRNPMKLLGMKKPKKKGKKR